MKQGRNFSVYLNFELLEKLERIKAHLGYGISQTIANLIDVRDKEIEDGVTRRETMTQVQEGIAALRRDVDRILLLLEDKPKSDHQKQIEAQDNLMNAFLEHQERTYRKGGMTTGYRLPEDNDPTVD